MESQPDLKKLVRNSCHHIEQDGLMEVYAGVVLMATSLCWGSNILMGILIFFAAFVCPKILERTRCKYTFPRLGYVKLFNSHRRFRPFLLAIFIIFYTGILVVVFSMEPKIKAFLNFNNILFPALSSMALVAGCIHSYYIFGLFRYLMYCPLFLALGVYFSIDNSSPLRIKTSYFFLIAGSLFLLTGLFVFVRFIRENKLQPEAQADGE